MRRRGWWVVLALASVLLAGCGESRMRLIEPIDQRAVDEIWTILDGVGPAPEFGQDLAAVPLQATTKPDVYLDRTPRFQAELDKERARSGTTLERELAAEAGRYLCSALSGGGMQLTKAQAVVGYFEITEVDAVPLFFAALRGFCPDAKNRYVSLTYANPVKDEPTTTARIDAARFFYVDLFGGDAEAFDSIRPRAFVRTGRRICAFDYAAGTPSPEQLRTWMPQLRAGDWQVFQMGVVSAFCPEQVDPLLADLGILNEL
ncbi:hypothetical protein ACLM5J_09855 [Nocardioides sp. Bht2]|uniref:hypothetical protein n=1 Tax=Nocardioides sp. Bht2 TaxID=3392297 RepID=UPI0039B6836A